MNGTTGDSVCYHISPLRQALPWFTLGPVFITGLVLSVFPEERLPGIILCAATAAGIILWHLILRYIRLEISPQGVLLRQLGFTMAVPWENIDHYWPGKRREGFVTRTPLGGKGARRLARISGFTYEGTPAYSPEQQFWMSAKRWIPIESFAYAMRDGRMREVVDRLAPGLLDRPALSIEQLSASQEGH